MRSVIAALSFACLVLGACTTPASRSDAATAPQVDSSPRQGIEAAAATTVTLPGVTGTLRHHARFPSRHVAARDVDVWLPPGYDADPGRRYPVVYAQDGQNLFYPKHAYTGD